MNINKFALHGLPRSGSTWIGEILNSSPNVQYAYQPLFSYALKSYLSDNCNLEEIEAFYRELLWNEDPFLRQTEARNSGKLPIFKKEVITHVGYKEVRYHNILPNFALKDKNVKFIFILRNPLSQINSWLNAPREFRADLGWQRIEEWRYAFKKNLNRPEEYNGYEKWKEASLLFYQLAELYPDRVVAIRYDQMLKNPVEETRKLLAFLELEYSDQTDSFLREPMESSADPYSVAREAQTDDKWMTQLEEEVVYAICQDLKGSPLEPLLDIDFGFSCSPQ